MKRIAVLEFIGCQKPPTRLDYPQVASLAIDDLSKEKIFSALLGEGDSMLLTIAAKFLQEGVSEVHCCRHESSPVPALGVFSSWSPRILDSIVWHPIKNGEEIFTRWIEVARELEMAIVIAPEIDDELLRATDALRAKGVKLLNADEAFITTASDKLLTSRAWRQSEVRQPWTRLMRNGLLHNVPLELLEQSAWVVKPRDGAGGIGIRRFDNFRLLEKWYFDQERTRNQLILQPWMHGRSASIVFIYHFDGTSEAMPARDQFLIETLSRESGAECQEVAYASSGRGWCLEHQAVAETFARNAINAIPGVPLGWIGVDFVCDGPLDRLESYIAIEINPRLTSSYRFIEE